MSSAFTQSLARHWRAALAAALGTVVLHAVWTAHSATAQAREAFDVEARIAHRLVSERLAALGTLLRALAASGLPDAADPRLPARLMALDGAVRGLGWHGALPAPQAGEPPPAATPGLHGPRLLLALDPAAPVRPYLSADVAALLPSGDRASALQAVRLTQAGTARAAIVDHPAAARPGWPLQFAVAKPLGAEGLALQFEAQGRAWLPWTLWLPSLAWGAGAAALVVLGGLLWQMRRERVRAERVAHLSQAGRLQALGELAAQVAHELNQPLAALVSQSQAARRLLADDGPPELVSQALEANVAQAQRATAIVARLRASVSGAPPVRVPVDLGERLREVLFLLEPRLAAKRVQTDSAGLAGLRVLADPVQVDQILHNLLANAVDALPAAPGVAPARIRVQAQRRDGWVQIGIEDNGPGIAAAVAERLFEPFVSTKPDGTGLGLAIARTLAEHLGGELTHDATITTGARFVLRLPQASP